MVNFVFTQVSKFVLPQLEYLELWLSGYYGYWDYDNDDNGELYYSYKNNSWTTFLFDNLMTACESFPNLKYLGLCSLDDADLLLEAILDSPLIERLSILNLSRGTLTDKGAELLLQSTAIKQLYMLDVSENLLSDNMIRRLSKLNCKVIADSQHYDISDRYDTMGERYCSLWE